MEARKSSFADFSQSEIEKVAQLKRFFEVTDGDSNFRSALEKNQISSEMLTRLRRIGVMLDLSEVAFLWEIPEATCLFFYYVSKGMRDQLPPETEKEIERYPLLPLWAKYNEAKNNGLKRLLKPDDLEIPGNPKLNAWRSRRIRSTKSELGHYGQLISHPLLVFELSEGCSVGCWFCCFAAQKLKGYLRFHEQKDFFTGIVESCIDIFGKSAAGWALPYYRSEPHDNPNYLDFLKEFERLTGAVLCTSTAVGSDIPWVRTLVEYYNEKEHPWPRFSVLSKVMMNQIHEAFTPYELRDQQLLMQMKDHTREKVTGGRILAENDGLRTAPDTAEIRNVQVPQGSIACATGFLINLVNRTVELFSPCYVSEKWPYGYRVYDKAEFQDEKDFHTVILKLIERNMFDVPPAGKPLRFRDDLIYRETPEGFDLISPNQIHHFRINQGCGSLGELIREGNHTCAEILNLLAAEDVLYSLNAKMLIQRLFDDGFIDEVYH